MMQPLPKKRHGLSRDEAEKLAISALSFLAGEEHRLAGFLHLTGLAPADLRREAGTPEFLAAVLDFIAADESLLLVFATEQRLEPTQVMIARQTLMPDASDY
jgi:hypothetical protein